MCRWTGSVLVQNMVSCLFGTKPPPTPMITFHLSQAKEDYNEILIEIHQNLLDNITFKFTVSFLSMHCSYRKERTAFDEYEYTWCITQCLVRLWYLYMALCYRSVNINHNIDGKTKFIPRNSVVSERQSALVTTPSIMHESTGTLVVVAAAATHTIWCAWQKYGALLQLMIITDKFSSLPGPSDATFIQHKVSSRYSFGSVSSRYSFGSVQVELTYSLQGYTTAIA